MIIIHFKGGAKLPMDNPAKVTSADINKRINEDMTSTIQLYNFVINLGDVLYIEVIV